MTDLNSAVVEFLASRKARGIAKNTIRNERGTLNGFLTVTGNILVKNINGRHIDMWFSAYPHLAPGTWNRNQGYLQGFFSWCRARKYMPRDYDPFEGVGKRPVPPRDFIFVPADRFGEMLDHARNGRDRIVLALGLYSLQRASESTELCWCHVMDSSPNPKEWHLNVFRTKTTSRTPIPLAAELKRELDRWKLEYGRIVGEVPRPEWRIAPAFERGLYTNDSDSGKLVRVGEAKLNPKARLNKPEAIVKYVLEEMGYPVTDREGTHTLRRSGGRALYEELAWERGYDGAIRTLQYMFGHKSLATTEHYLRLTLEQKRAFELLAGSTMFPSRNAEVVELHAKTDGRSAGL